MPLFVIIAVRRINVKKMPTIRLHAAPNIAGTDERVEEAIPHKHVWGNAIRINDGRRLQVVLCKRKES